MRWSANSIEGVVQTPQYDTGQLCDQLYDHNQLHQPTPPPKPHCAMWSCLVGSEWLVFEGLYPLMTREISLPPLDMVTSPCTEAMLGKYHTVILAVTASACNLSWGLTCRPH